MYSKDVDESKGIIVEECFKEADKSERIHTNINKQKDAENEAEYGEYPDTHEVTSYYNILECGRNIFNRLDLKY